MIALFGAPGAGKTVQGKLLANRYGWRWVSSRDLLLGLHDEDVTMALNNGMYIDEDIMARTMQQIFRNSDHHRRMILDGFPNTVEQVYWMRDHGVLKDLEGAIVLDVPRGELWARIISRGRVDDTRAAYERRQDLYDRAITGILHVIAENGIKTATVNGCNEPSDVLARIEEVLGDWGIIQKKQFKDIPTRLQSPSTNATNLMALRAQLANMPRSSTLGRAGNAEAVATIIDAFLGSE